MAKLRTKRPEYFIKRVFASIGGYITGELKDIHGIGRVFWTSLTVELFTLIHKSYKARSEGGADDLGNTFKPLARSTIAQRPIGTKQLSQFGLTKKQSGTSFKDRKRGLLSPEEDAEWRRKYSSVLSQLMLKINYSQAQVIAAKIAWAHVKKMGARTRLDVLGDRNVLIMRITDRIFDSLEPSINSNRGYRPKKNQLYKQTGNKLEIGTLVEYAKYHNKSRPVIPDNYEPWVRIATEKAMSEVINHIKDRVL